MMKGITDGEIWKCPFPGCDYEITKGEPGYYSSGDFYSIEELQCKVYVLDRALTHIITEHLLKEI